METLEADSMPLDEPPPGTSYSLALGNGSEIVTSAGDLVTLGDTGEGDLNEDSTKDLPLLIIQERLEEPATVSEPESVEGQEKFPKEINTIQHDDASCMEDSVLGVADDDDPSDCQKLVIINGSENPQDHTSADQEMQQTGYLVYNPTDQTLRVASSKVTPLLVLANNTDRGMYEANVIFSQSTVANQIIKLEESQAPQHKLQAQAATSTSSEPTTITMTVDGDTQLLLESQQTSGQLLYVCDLDHCRSAFASLEEYHQHQLCHVPRENGTYKDMDIQGVNNRNLVCPYEGCNRTFAWPTHLKYHELTHTGKRMFKCEEEGCGACFYTVQRLAVHRRIHTGEKPFVCPEANCGKAFITHGNLKNHLRIHSGEKPYACDIQGCNRRFAEHSSLRKHTLVHTGSKPYVCNLCGKKFSQSGSRNVHMKRHQTLNEEKEKVMQKQLENERTEAGSTDLVGKLRNEKMVILQQAHAELLQGYVELPTSESVVYSNAVTDHVVTVTTQPAECEANNLQIDPTLGRREELCHQDVQSQPRTPNSTTGANVVVLSQPEEMVAMAPGYHHVGEETPKDMVYACHQLLNVDIT